MMDIIKSILVWIIGICFMVIMFPLTFLTWFILLPFDKKRSIIHWLLVYQSIAISRFIPIWKINISGRENAIKGTTYVIISNHQSILDILLMTCLRYKFKWVSKIENLNVPILGWYIRMADYITVNRGNEDSKIEMLEKSYNCLQNGTSIMIFPEGTRSLDNKIGFFKRGAFQLAIQANVPILPVLIDGTGGILPKHGLIFTSGHSISIRVLDPILPSSFDTSSPDILAQKLNSLMVTKIDELRNSKFNL